MTTPPADGPPQNGSYDEPSYDPAADQRNDGQTGGPPSRGGRDSKDPLRRSRTSGTWIAIIVFAILLVLMLVFIAQNTDDVRISFLMLDGDAPLAVAILGAGVAGVLLTVVAGTLRILQLRRRVKRDA